MKLKLAFLAVFMIGFSVSAVALDTHETKIRMGETIEMSDYEIRFNSQQGDMELTIGKWTGTSFMVFEKLDPEEIFDSEGEEMKFSGNLSVKINRTGYDEDGRFLELEITGDENLFSSGKMTTSTPENLIISQGESAEIPLTISNTGFLNQSFSLGFESNSSLSVSYSFQDFNVTDIYMPAGEENSVTATVEVPETAELGQYDLELYAESNETRLPESFRVDVRGSEVEKDINLDVEQSYTQTAAGDTIEIPLTVRNGVSGFIRPGMDEGPVLENVQFDVTVPEGWDYELSPEGFQTVSSRGIERSVLSVDVPENAQTGDYFIDVSVSSDETSLEEPIQVRANVQEQNSMGIVGVIIMAVSVGLLLLVYRKFGRR